MLRRFAAINIVLLVLAALVTGPAVAASPNVSGRATGRPIGIIPVNTHAKRLESR